MNLCEVLKKELAQYKVQNIKHPIFYNFPIGICFEIGKGTPWDANDRINKSYVNNALKRCVEIFNALNLSDKCLMIFDFISQEDEHNKRLILKFREKISGRVPREQYTFKVNDEDEITEYQRCLFKISAKDILETDLFREIILADFRGMRELTSAVFIFDLEQHILFHLYDDRGLDVFATDILKLLPIYKEFNDWILEGDREKVDKLFLN